MESKEVSERIPSLGKNLMDMKSKWVVMQHNKRNNNNDSASVPEYGHNHLPTDEIHPSTYSLHPLSEKLVKSTWQPQQQHQQQQQHQTSSVDWNPGMDCDNVPHSVPHLFGRHRGGESEEEQGIVAGPHLHDDELESWLQYPGEDPLENPPPAPESPWCMPTLSSQKESPSKGNPVSTARAAPPLPASRAANAEAALAMAAQRAAGLLPPMGGNTFHKVRTVSPPLKQGTLPLAIRCNKETPTPPAHSTKGEPLNFSHFSRPAALYQQRASMAAAAASSGKQAYGHEHSSSNQSTISAGESTVVTYSHSQGCQVSAPGSRRSGDQQQQLPTRASWEIPLLPKNYTHGQTLPKSQSMVKGQNGGSNSQSPGQQKQMQNGGSRNQSPGHKQTQNGRAALLGGMGSGVSSLGRRSSVETTVTSSCGAENSEPTSQRGGSAEKRNREDYEGNFETEDEFGENSKKSRGSNGRGPAKRSRAAEVHNLSERRRRDRINERMKQLQELIPNSNKTDKASMLDEAIEYLKMLQMQLQVMSMRTGMGMSPLLPGQMLPVQSLPSQVTPTLGSLQPHHPHHALSPMMAPSMAPMGQLAGLSQHPPPPMGMGYYGHADMVSMAPQRQLSSQSMEGVGPMMLPARGAHSEGGLDCSLGGNEGMGGMPRQMNPSAVDPLSMYLARHQQQQRSHHLQQQLQQQHQTQMHQQQSQQQHQQAESQAPGSLEMYHAYMMQQQGLGMYRH